LYYELNSLSFIWNRNWSGAINESVVTSQSDQHVNGFLLFCGAIFFQTVSSLYKAQRN